MSELLFSQYLWHQFLFHLNYNASLVRPIPSDLSMDVRTVDDHLYELMLLQQVP